MKKLAVLIAAGIIGLPAFAQSSHYVRPHIRSDGTYVQGHQQTNPDSSRLNNWSSQGNTNPYTGQGGNVNPWAQPQPSYSPPTYTPPTFGQQCGYTSSGQYICR